MCFFVCDSGQSTKMLFTTDRVSIQVLNLELAEHETQCKVTAYSRTV